MSDPIESAKTGIALVGEIMKAAGDNPDVKESGYNLGKSALTITRTINNALLPLAAVNFAFDKARTYFAEHFQQDIAAKAASIPVEQVIEPKASIAGPALQGLAFCHEEPNLKDMYLSLLATSMDGRVAIEAHPAFVEIIKQLNSNEAHLLREVLRLEGLPIVEIRVESGDGHGWRILESHLLNLCNLGTGEPFEDPKQPAIVDNWIRLGLVAVDYTKTLVGENVYEWVAQRPEFLKHKTDNEKDGAKVSFQRGRLGRTALGIQFGRAVGLLE